MIRLEEFQVKCYGKELPKRSIVELSKEIEGENKEKVADALGDLLVYISKYADKIGYTLSEIAER